MYIREGDKLKGAAVYYKINDAAYQGVKDGEIDMTNPEQVGMLLYFPGENLLFTHVVADGFRTVLKGLRKVIEKEKPNRVSWLSPNMSFREIKFRR